MRLLELFSGTMSVGKEAEKMGYEVTSLDINDYKGKYIPTHLEDIMEWDYKQYKPGYFDVIWSSPPCVNYSNLQFSWVGRKKKINGILTTFTKEMLYENMDQSDQIILKVFEIFDYFKPKYWFLENPQTSHLKKRYMMIGLPYYDVDYCMYCNWGYRKRTRIWTNKKFVPKICNYKCGNMNKSGIKHKYEVGNDIHGIDRYRIPPNLVNELLK